MDDGSSGRELWASDGTSNSTRLVKDIFPGEAAPPMEAPSSDPFELTDAGNYLLFSARSLEHGRELWRSDGTAEGTMLVRDIHTGPFSTEIVEMESVGTRVFILQNRLGLAKQLWVSDGTGVGTRVLQAKDGSQLAWPSELTPADGTLYFTSGNNGHEVWRTDGTDAGTLRLTNLHDPNRYIRPNQLIGVSTQLFFVVQKDDYYRELWFSDGTAAGTRLVKDIYVEGAYRNISWLTASNGRLFFVADDGIHGRELWMSDGTPEGTRMVTDMVAGPGGSDPQTLVDVAGILFFNAVDANGTRKLWRSDGTPEGTQVVADVVPDYKGVVVGQSLFFVVSTSDGEKLWRSDGTPQGTVLVTRDSVYGLTPFDDRLLFATYANGRKLWVSDGTAEGTYQIPNAVPVSNGTRWLATVPGRRLAFFAGLGAGGVELWQTDGTEDGTFRVQDIAPGAGSSVPRWLFSTADRLFFSADDTTNGRELWSLPFGTSGEPVVELQPGMVASLVYQNSLGGSVTVDVPAQAVSETTQLRLRSGAVSTLAQPSFRFAGQAFRLEAKRGSEIVAPFHFNQHIRVSVRYTNGVSNSGEQHLRLLVREGMTWVDAASTCAPALYEFAMKIVH